MFKPKLKFILLILIFAWGNARGQGPEQLYNRYIKMRYSSQRPDTLNITINTIGDLDKIINSGSKNKVYSVEIKNTSGLDLSRIFSVLMDFKNLTFLIINDWVPPAQTSVYQLPDNIQLLQQLKGIEFSRVTYMDVDDAIKKIATLKQLQLLSFFECKYELPPQIAELKNIKAVRLSPQNITNIDVSQTNWQIVDMGDYGGSSPAQTNEKALINLSYINSLRRLELVLVYLNDSITVLSRFKQLNTLGLNGISLTSKVLLFKKLGSLQNLQNLSIRLWDDSLSFDGIGALKNLRYLSVDRISGSGTHNPPKLLDSLRHLKKLESLELEGLDLESIPDIFTGLLQLKKLNLWGNLFAELPQSIFKLPDLEYLNVSSNKLTTLPGNQNYGCKNLKILDLRGNDLTALPPAITRLPQLENINVSENDLQTVSDGWQNLGKLKEVDLSKNKLAVFPGGLQENHNVRSISIYDNRISVIPDVTGNNYNLKSLTAWANPLTSLPEHIGKYAELEVLEVSGGKLTSLPESLGDCTKLAWLSINSSIASPTVLPASLKNAKNLGQLDLTNDPLLDSKSIFDVILSMPRKNFQVDISHNNITRIPASSQWANMTFGRLDLSYNKLSSLPVEFATLKIPTVVVLDHNLIKGNENIRAIKDKGDMKILFDNMGIALPDYPVSNREYAIALTNYIPTFYEDKMWGKAVEYVQKAIAIDSNAYNENAPWDKIGMSRFNLKDYTGAIKDFDRCIYEQPRPDLKVLLAKAEAHLALGQKEEAAKTYMLLGGFEGYEKAAIISKELNNEKLYRQVIDTALSVFKQRMKTFAKLNYTVSGFILDYTELLIITGQTGDAIEVLNLNERQLRNFSKQDLPAKSLLTAMVKYLIDPASYIQLKQSLTDAIAQNGKIQNRDFTLFNKLLSYSGLSKTQQEDLLALENIAK